MKKIITIDLENDIAIISEFGKDKKVVSKADLPNLDKGKFTQFVNLINTLTADGTK